MSNERLKASQVGPGMAILFTDPPGDWQDDRWVWIRVVLDISRTNCVDHMFTAMHNGVVVFHQRETWTMEEFLHFVNEREYVTELLMP